MLKRYIQSVFDTFIKGDARDSWKSQFYLTTQ